MGSAKVTRPISASPIHIHSAVIPSRFASYPLETDVFVERIRALVADRVGCEANEPCPPQARLPTEARDQLLADAAALAQRPDRKRGEFSVRLWGSKGDGGCWRNNRSRRCDTASEKGGLREDGPGGVQDEPPAVSDHESIEPTWVNKAGSEARKSSVLGDHDENPVAILKNKPVVLTDEWNAQLSEEETREGLSVKLGQGA